MLVFTAQCAAVSGTMHRNEQFVDSITNPAQNDERKKYQINWFAHVNIRISFDRSSRGLIE